MSRVCHRLTHFQALRAREEILALRNTIDRRQLETEHAQRAEGTLAQNQYTTPSGQRSSKFGDTSSGSIDATEMSWGVNMLLAPDGNESRWTDSREQERGVQVPVTVQLSSQKPSPTVVALQGLTNDSHHASGSPSTSETLLSTLTHLRRACTLPTLTNSAPVVADMPEGPLEQLQDQLPSIYCASPVMADDRDAMSIGPKLTLSSHNLRQDMASVSNSEAGPSVQLVERMSAAVRRLEAEKLAGREELNRISTQRDEARSEIITLMKTLEEQRAASQQTADLEREAAALQSRYQTTLELLGEKSEQVDELRADINDLKQMYRELLEQAVPS